jgi:hypothetical protein
MAFHPVLAPPRPQPLGFSVWVWEPSQGRWKTPLLDGPTEKEKQKNCCSRGRPKRLIAEPGKPEATMRCLHPQWFHEV